MSAAATFAAGMSSQTITARPLGDEASEGAENDGGSGSETVVMSIASGSGYTASSGNATVTIAPTPPPTVSVTASQPKDPKSDVWGKRVDLGGLRIIRKNGYGFTVNLTNCGTAQRWTGYTAI